MPPWYSSQWNKTVILYLIFYRILTASHHAKIFSNFQSYINFREVAFPVLGDHCKKSEYSQMKIVRTPSNFFYLQPVFLKYRFRTYNNLRRSEDRLVSRVRARFGADAVYIFGDRVSQTLDIMNQSLGKDSANCSGKPDPRSCHQ